ncbi:MAG: sugar phosphate isomerase/epimerase family protein [Phycisphaerales bacterium]
MHRPVTLFTGQWADLPLSELAPKARAMGFDGLELACWGDHFDVRRAVEEPAYCRAKRELLAEHGLACHAISNHLVGQAVCDPIDERHRSILPGSVWGDGEPEGVRRRAAEEMQLTARAARAMGVDVVNGFTGSPIWHMLYFFPPTPASAIDAGYREFADRWNPILDVFDEVGVRFALEVHPTEVAYDAVTTERALDAVGRREAFGINFDPSHLVWQGVDPARFVRRFGDRIYHAHMKDAARREDGDASILGSHLAFGDHRRAWDFRSVGRGEVDFDAIIRALNAAGYSGPLSVEWEDPDMDRFHGAEESCAFVRSMDFMPADRAFDSAFDGEDRS